MQRVWCFCKPGRTTDTALALGSGGDWNKLWHCLSETLLSTFLLPHQLDQRAYSAIGFTSVHLPSSGIPYWGVYVDKPTHTNECIVI